MKKPFVLLLGLALVLAVQFIHAQRVGFSLNVNSGGGYYGGGHYGGYNHRGYAAAPYMGVATVPVYYGNQGYGNGGYGNPGYGGRPYRNNNCYWDRGWHQWRCW